MRLISTPQIKHDCTKYGIKCEVFPAADFYTIVRLTKGFNTITVAWDKLAYDFIKVNK